MGVVDLHFKIETLVYMMSVACLAREQVMPMKKKILAFHKARLKELKVESEDYTSSESEI